MYYYNQNGRQTQANSFNSIVENYKYRAATGSDSNGMLIGGIAVVALIGGVVVYMMMSKNKKNAQALKFGNKFIY